MLGTAFDFGGLAIKVGVAGVIGGVAGGVYWYRSAPNGSVPSLVVRLLLALLVFPAALLVWLILLALAGDAAFTEGVVHGGIVAAGIIAAIPVLLALRRWDRVVREGSDAGRRFAGALIAVGALAAIVVAGVGLARYFGHAPNNLALPTVSGTPRVGQTLHADPGRWDARGADSLDFDYSWFRCRRQNCAEFETTPEDEYLLDKHDLGARISVTVTAYGDLNELADSKPTPPIRRQRDYSPAIAQ
jgi:hypothetical protein